MKVLIVGGSSVSGQCAIKAVKALGTQNEIITTSSRTEDVSGAGAGADFTIGNIALDESGAVDAILKDEHVKNIDYVIYIPARGEVGIPAAEATKQMVEESLDYCFRPFLRLHKALQPKKGIALSGFITMQPLLEIYGAMTFTKIAMEQLAVKYPKKIQLLRIGMFHSNSVRGIALLVQRRLNRNKDFNPTLYQRYKASGRKFTDFFYDQNYRFEEESFKQHANGIAFRPTEPRDIQAAFEMALKGEDGAIINVLGAWRWTENEMPYLPPDIADNLHLIPDDLEQLLIG